MLTITPVITWGQMIPWKNRAEPWILYPSTELSHYSLLYNVCESVGKLKSPGSEDTSLVAGTWRMPVGTYRYVALANLSAVYVFTWFYTHTHDIFTSQSWVKVCSQKSSVLLVMLSAWLQSEGPAVFHLLTGRAGMKTFTYSCERLWAERQV